MATNKGQMTDEVFRQLITQDYWISHMAYPVNCCDKNGVHTHWCTCTYPDEYILSEEQVSEAKRKFCRLHDEYLQSIKKGELVFVASGMDYNSGLPEGVNNYCIHCDFKNARGEQFAIYLATSFRDDKLYVDFSIDRQLQKKYDEEYRRRREFNRGKPYREQDHRDIPQYYYNAKNVEKNQDVRIEPTWPAVIRFINSTYGCNYTSARLFRYYIVNADEYVCEC